MITARYTLPLCLTLALPAPATPQHPTLIVENGRVIIGDGTVLDRASVVIAGDRIVSITEEPIDAPGAERIDATGRTVLPGLIDAHVHLTIGPSVTDSASLEAYLEGGTAGFLRDFLHHGVTTVRSTGDYWPWIGHLRDRIDAGEVEGARIVTSGPVVTFRDAYPAGTVCRGRAFCRSGLVAEVDDVGSARATVRRLAREGVDFIKITSDTVFEPVQMPDDVTAAIIAEGHRQGIEVVAHVAEEPFIRRLAEMGLDGFVHPTLRPLPPDRARALADVLMQHGTPLTSTMSAFFVYSDAPVERFLAPDAREETRRTAQPLVTMHEAGVQVVVGSDWCPCGRNVMRDAHPAIRPGAVTITEMELLGWGGLSTEAVLAAATANAARVIGRAETLGTLEPGKLADLIVVDGNPLEDLSHLRNVRVVVKEGLAQDRRVVVKEGLAQDKPVVAMIGTGNLAGTFGPAIGRVGYPVVYGSRDPARESVRALVERTGPNASATSPSEAASRAQIIVLAVPGEVVEEVAGNLGDLDGKILLDVAGGLKRVAADGYLELVSDSTKSERIQSRHPTARVVRIYLPSIAFFDDPLLVGTPPSIFIAGHDPRAREAVAHIIFDVGLDPADAGPLRFSRVFDALGVMSLVPAQQGRTDTYDLRLLPSPPLSCFMDVSALFGFGGPYDLDSLPRFPRRDPPASCEEWRRRLGR